MMSWNRRLTADEYMDQSYITQCLGPYCTKDGIPMIPLRQDGYGPITHYCCGHCGIIIDRTGKKVNTAILTE